LNKAFTRAHKATDVTRSRSPNYPWRHTYCSIGLTNGGQPAFLASQTGHSLEMFYSTYAKWIDTDDDREAIEQAFPEPGMGAKMGADD
jgi:integrase